MPHNWIIVKNQDDPAALKKKINTQLARAKFTVGKVETYWDVQTRTAYVWVDGPGTLDQIKALAWALEAIDVVTVLDYSEAQKAFKQLKP